MNQTNYINRAKKVLAIESEAVLNLQSQIDEYFIEVCERIKNIKGRVIVTGMGKSGHVGSKIAATLASTGTPAFFVHPAEASHGDLGMVTKEDIVIALSNSGETDEILAVVPIIARQSIPLISLTGNADSSLARLSDYHILVKVKEEACPLGLAPTASTTAALAMGDAIAVTLLEMRGFTADDFAFSHPGGKLGRRLLLRVSDVMEPFEDCAVLPKEATLSDVLLEMTKFPVGIMVSIDSARRVEGVFSEGDLRRVLVKGENPTELTLGTCMTTDPYTIEHDALAVDAVALMEEKRITALPVLSDDNELLGVVNMHHLLKARVI